MAAAVLRQGYTVVVDASFLSSAERQAIQDVAAKERVPFMGAWLDAPVDVLLSRVRTRAHDASDADERVVCQQLRTPPRDVAWARIDTTIPIDGVERQLVAGLARIGESR